MHAWVRALHAGARGDGVRARCVQPGGSVEPEGGYAVHEFRQEEGVVCEE